MSLREAMQDHLSNKNYKQFVFDYILPIYFVISIRIVKLPLIEIYVSCHFCQYVTLRYVNFVNFIPYQV
jgi:hypothetical protein